MTDTLTVDSPTVDPLTDPRFRPYQPYGTAIEVLYDKSPQLLYCGPSGTGKSRAILEKLHILCCKYPGMRALIVRKTRTSITQSAMVTYNKFVIPDNGSVMWRTGEQEYRYANGSVIVVGGMDKATKILSSDYDIIYVQEAIELSEEDWETLSIRCRFGVVPYQQLIGDTNPGPPSHWLKQKADAGTIMMRNSHHEDNPRLYDHVENRWTKFGQTYLDKLGDLSGVRRKRYLLGLWAAAEGMIYTEWDPEVHLVDRFYVPADWTRIWAVDFGFTNPFCWQCWAVDPDGRLYRIAELYQTQLLVEDAAALIKAWRVENLESAPAAIICDHDAEDRATLERHLGMETMGAIKTVSDGIQAVKSRLKVQKDGKPRIMFMRDSLLEPDQLLIEAMKPLCAEQEIEGYEWVPGKIKDTVKKKNDHAMDAVRYVCAYMRDSMESWVIGMKRG